MRYRIADESQFAYNEGRFERVSDVVKRWSAVAGVNLGFFGTVPGKPHPQYSTAVGQLIIQGTQYRGIVPDSRHFHVLQSRGGHITIQRTMDPDAAWGLGMGPRLIENGQISDNIFDPHWQAGGTDTGGTKPRPAVATFGDGRTLICAFDKTPCLEMAIQLLNMGCKDAIACDGGGSTSFTDTEHRIYAESKPTPNALILLSGPSEYGEVEEVVKRVICIDPGHGKATDPGAVASDGTMEADINLDIGLKLGQYLTQSKLYEVVFTHKDGRELRPHMGATAELQARCDVANRARSSLFVSIHCDWFTVPTVRGTRIHRYPTSARGLAVAKTVANGIRPLAMISGVPAQCMDSYFYVLKNTWMPAILVECGFMSNRDDLTLLNMAVHRDKVALALAMTIMRSDEKGEF